MKTLQGLVTATFTPFHTDGSLNLSPIKSYADWLIQQRVGGAFICGTTGESMSLTTAERIQLAEQWSQVTGERLPLIVHVGHNSIADATELARHAQHIGAAAIAALSPSFFKPATVTELVDFCAAVAGAAPRLPFYYYQIPAMTGVPLTAIDFLRAAAGKIPTLAGVKFTNENLLDLQHCLAFDDRRLNILFGRDEILLAGLTLGCTGAVGSTYNWLASIFHRVIRAFETGDLATARREQYHATQLISLAIRYDALPAMKAIMEMLGIDCGPVRLPLATVAGEKAAKLRADLQQLGYFEMMGIRDV